MKAQLLRRHTDPELKFSSEHSGFYGVPPWLYLHPVLDPKLGLRLAVTLGSECDSSPPIKGELASNKRFIVHTDESIIDAHSSQREPCYTGVNESVGTKRAKSLYNLNLELWSALLTEGQTPLPLCPSVRPVTDDCERII